MIVSETISDGPIIIGSRADTLFGELPLSEELSEDTDIGQLILTSCTSVYIALLTSDSKVYEVEIVTDNKINFKGYRRNNLYLVLTRFCIQDLGLIPDVNQRVELQFQLNRQPSYLMHFALDNMDSIDIVFPDPVKNVFLLKIKPTRSGCKEFAVVIISNVRTSTFLANNCDESNQFDFFFNKKLLNTAMTRAKYSVIVVGDPVALCTYGKCSQIWQLFINRCSELCSVEPAEITDVIRSAVNLLLFAPESFIQQAGATWVPSSQLQTGINFSTETMNGCASNLFEYEYDAYDYGVAYDRSYSLCKVGYG